MFDNTAAWLLWWLLVAIVLYGLISLFGCGPVQTFDTGSFSVQYLNSKQMISVCGSNRARACAYPFSNGQCFIYIDEKFKNNASWNSALREHEYLHCTGQIQPTQ